MSTIRLILDMQTATYKTSNLSSPSSPSTPNSSNSPSSPSSPNSSLVSCSYFASEKDIFSDCSTIIGSPTESPMISSPIFDLSFSETPFVEKNIMILGIFSPNKNNLINGLINYKFNNKQIYQDTNITITLKENDTDIYCSFKPIDGAWLDLITVPDSIIIITDNTCNEDELYVKDAIRELCLFHGPENIMLLDNKYERIGYKYRTYKTLCKKLKCNWLNYSIESKNYPVLWDWILR